jgi:hypothetical protein
MDRMHCVDSYRTKYMTKIKIKGKCMCAYCVGITKFSHPPSHRGLRGEQKLTCVPGVVREVHAKLVLILHTLSEMEKGRDVVI